MNILFLMGVFPGVGGVERVTTVLANKFSKEGHNVSLISFWDGDDSMFHTLSNKVEVIKYRLPVDSRYNRQKLHDYILSNNVDVIINQWCIPYYVSHLIATACKNTYCRYIAVHHNLPTTNAQIKKIEDKIVLGRGFYFFNKIHLWIVVMISRLSLRYAYEKSDKFVLLSQSFIPITKKFIFLKDAIKLTSISNPITLTEENATITDKEKVILYVGRIEYIQKRPDRLIEVWKLLECKYPDWKLRIIGDGPYKSELLRLIAENGLRNVSIEGYQDPTEYYKKARVLLLTSDFEGFGLVIVEGMRFGVVPVVYGSYEAVYDIVQDGKNGFITGIPFSAEDMANRVSNIIENENFEAKLRINALKSSSKFSLDTIYNKWMNLISDII